jgi:hypothetical protein
MLTKPRTVCFCQPVVATISARVAPLARFIIAITSALLLVRSAGSSFGARPRRALAPFLGAAAFALFLALGAPFFWPAPFFEGTYSGATCAPWSATVAALSFVSVVM